MVILTMNEVKNTPQVMKTYEVLYELIFSFDTLVQGKETLPQRYLTVHRLEIG